MDWLDLIKEHLDTFYHATDIPVLLQGQDGKILFEAGEENRFCRRFRECAGENAPCETLYRHARREVPHLKDGYVLACPSGYVHFASACFHEGKCRATAIAGPVVTDYPDMEMTDQVIRQFHLSVNERSRLYAASTGTKLVEPDRVRYLCKLLAGLMGSVISQEDNILVNRYVQKSVQQAKIGEYIQMLKSMEGEADAYSFEQEEQLIASVVSGQESQAKALLNELLGRIYFSSGNNFEVIRTRSIELLVLMSRAILENGGDPGDIYQMTDSGMKEILAAKDLTDLSYSLLEILDAFLKLAFVKIPQPESPILRKALSYIGEHCYGPITLGEVAAHVGVNSAYLSTLFAREMGIGFSEYITKKRLEQARMLLRKSNLSLSEVAMAVGYDNQSYFSKVFKAATGRTPRQYREEAGS